MKGIKSKDKVYLKLTKKTKVSLDRDNNRCNKSTVQRIMKATNEELEEEYQKAEGVSWCDEKGNILWEA